MYTVTVDRNGRFGRYVRTVSGLDIVRLRKFLAQEMTFVTADYPLNSLVIETDSEE